MPDPITSASDVKPMTTDDLRDYDEATRRAEELYPPPPPDAPSSEQRQWAQRIVTYREKLIEGWRADRQDHGAAMSRRGIHKITPVTMSTVSNGDAIKAVTIGELLAMKLKPREYVLKPWLREKETGMVHAWRGVGKTHLALNIAVAVASGGSFLDWTAPVARRVLYLDGEMPTETMQERLAAIIAGSPYPEPNPENLTLVCADLQDGAALNLADVACQEALAPLIAEAELVIVDSISTLTSTGPENEAESWLPLQGWALQLRRQGKTLLFFHHDGKNGQQRGTSRREDILDVTIALKHPADYQPADGARFEVHFKKCRALYGTETAPIETALRTENGRAVWTVRAQEQAQEERARALFADGCPWQDVAQELGVSRATAFRLKRKSQAGRASSHVSLLRE